MEKDTRCLNADDQGWHKSKIVNLEDYAYLSNSRIKYLYTSMRAFQRRYIQGHKAKDTPAKILGRIVHKAILEPEDFLNRYVIEEKFSGKGSVAAKKEWRESLEMDAIVLTDETADKILFMIESVQNHPRASKILKGANFEIHGYYYDERLDQWFYGILDILKNSSVSDLKSAKCANHDAFGKDVENYKYYVQASIYLDMAKAIFGHKMDHYLIIVIENQEPFTTMVYPMPQYLIAAGRQIRDTITKQYQDQMEKYFKDPKSTLWAGYGGDTDISEFNFPYWGMKKIEALQGSHVGF